MTYDCTKCKYFGKQTCVPNGFGCTYEPILPTLDRQTIKLRKLEKEKEQLQNNWNELKKWLEEEITNDKGYEDLVTHCLSIQDLIDEEEKILEKMNELEGKSE